MTQATEYGYEILIMECKEFVLGRLHNGSFDRTVKIQVRFSGSAGGGTEPAGEYTFFYGKVNENHELGTGFLCIRESYQQLRGLSLLVTSYHACTSEFFTDLLVCLGTYHFRKDIPQFDVYS
jgi:hypothetical protein